MMTLRFILLTSLIFFAHMLNAEVVSKQVSYQSNGDPLKGYLAYQDDGEQKKPAVLVVHEWWGHNDYARRRADMLAELGYVAFALDMYGDGKVANHPDDAKKFMQEAMGDEKAFKDRFLSALHYVQQLNNVDSTKIAAIGYCFGGAVVINMARMGVDLKGVASFHGSLATSTPAKKDTVVAQVIVFHGANDAFIPEQQLEDFRSEMLAANVSHEVIVYEAVDHSFTNPDADMFAEKFSMPLSYDQDADVDSWEKLQIFLKKIFNI
ncbi:MAG: dienelactone hydrolase family protein [Gammaproteobacteria bacterium]|nr:dienelactone hydrolase family protein [Gammaproteobacteria bacterium]